MPYAEVAFRVMRPFIGDAFSDEEFYEDVEAAYDSFAHPAVVPLSQIGPNQFLLVSMFMKVIQGMRSYWHAQAGNQHLKQNPLI